MLEFNIEFVFTLHERLEHLLELEHKAAYENLGHAVASIRKTAIESIQFGKGPSTPGTPPHTHGRRFNKKGKQNQGRIQKAIIYDVDRDGLHAFVGPNVDILGTSGAAHELGGEYKGEDYPERPFMRPSLEKNLDRFAEDWQYAIGE